MKITNKTKKNIMTIVNGKWLPDAQYSPSLDVYVLNVPMHFIEKINQIISLGNLDNINDLLDKISEYDDMHFIAHNYVKFENKLVLRDNTNSRYWNINQDNFNKLLLSQSDIKGTVAMCFNDKVSSSFTDLGLVK